jgi:hypothetical protein
MLFLLHALRRAHVAPDADEQVSETDAVGNDGDADDGEDRDECRQAEPDSNDGIKIHVQASFAGVTVTSHIPYAGNSLGLPARRVNQ